MPKVIEVSTAFEVEKFYLKDAMPDASINIKREKQATSSLEVWEGFSPEYQQAFVEIVSKTLEFLHGSAKNWVPFCILTGSDGGDRIDLIMSLLLSDLESQVDIFEEGTNFEIESAKRRLMTQMAAEASEVASDEDFVKEIRETARRGHRPSVADTERLLDLLD